MSILQLETKLTRIGENSHYIPIPENTAQQALAQFGKRIFCTVNGRYTFHCALQRTKKLGYFIMAGKNTIEKLHLESGEAFDLTIEEDTSKYKAEMPEELQATLETDPESEVIFGTLTPGFQRSIIHYVDAAKRTETRIDRALKILERLKMGITDRKELFR